MTKLLNYLWRIWFLIIVIIATILCGLLVYPLSFSPKTFRACYFFMRIWCIILFYSMGFRYELTSPTGKIIDPEKKYVFILESYLYYGYYAHVYITPQASDMFCRKKGIGEDSHIWHYL